MIATCPNEINLFCSLLRTLGIEELLKLPIGIANSVYNFRSNLTNSDVIYLRKKTRIYLVSKFPITENLEA